MFSLNTLHHRQLLDLWALLVRATLNLNSIVPNERRRISQDIDFGVIDKLLPTGQCCAQVRRRLENNRGGQTYQAEAVAEYVAFKAPS